MNNNYGGVIWTNHAIDRLRERGISQGDAWATFRHPDHSRYADAKGAWIYYKTYGRQIIEVVAKQNEKKEWLIISVWSKPAHGHGIDSKVGSKKGFIAFLRYIFTGK